MFEKTVIRRVAPKKKYKVWITLKGVNSNSLDPNHDPGQDGNGLSANHLVARDAMGYSLHYYDGDYGAINGNNTAYGNQDGSDMATHSFDLFNGNIGRMVTTITDPDSREALPMGNAYKYDQLNRLREARSFTNYDASSNAWGSGQAALYYNAFTFDANGNIETQERWNAANQKIDQLEYKYKKNSADKLLRNRLYSVIDLVDPTLFTDDIDDMGFIAGNPIETANNYIYDQEGRLIEDKAEKISLTWRVDGKVKTVKQSDGKTGEYSLSFDYDAMGHRIAKHSYDKDPTYNNGLGQLVKSTYYILDASGNTMAVYEREINNTASTITFTQEEKHIYGSSRLGVMNDSIPLLGSQNDTYDQSTWVHTIGKRTYELANHLGNVLSVISDKVIPHANGTTVDYFLADIRQSTDYSPFGVTLEGRNFTASGADGFRYGYNGMEADDQLKGSGNSYDFGARILDSRLGRWLIIDQFAKDYTSLSPYSFCANSPEMFYEVDGNWFAQINLNPVTQKYEVQFVAEENDNLQTLSLQLGIAESEILTKHPELATITIINGNVLTLQNLEQVANINHGINEIGKLQDQTNCAMLADYCDGGSTIGWYSNKNSGGVQMYEEKIVKDYIAIANGSDARIGDVLTYRLTENWKDEELAAQYAYYGVDPNSARPLQKSYIENQTMNNFNGERHYSILLLKDKTGTNPQDIIQKNGGLSFDFKVDNASDLTVPGSGTGRAPLTPINDLKYESAPPTGETSVIFREKTN